MVSTHLPLSVSCSSHHRVYTERAPLVQPPTIDADLFELMIILYADRE